MKKVLMMIVIMLCVFCSAFVFAACDDATKLGNGTTGNGTNTGNGTQTEQPGGETNPGSGETNPGSGTQTEQPDGDQNKPHEHNFTNYVYNNDATCTKDGTETGKCSCGESDTREKQDSALGHTFETYISNGDATCTENGTETATCVRCTEQDTREEQDSALGHTFEVYISNGDATCTENGTETATCVRCTAQDTREEQNSALGHEWDAGVVTPATCTTPGQTYYICNHNPAHHKTEDIEIDPDAHNYGDWIPQIDAGCEKDGILGHFQCEYCEQYFDAQHERLDSLKINALGHKYKEALGYDRYTHYSVCEYCNEKADITYHAFGDNKTCADCHYKADYTLGLEFELNEDGTTCALMGIGSATDTDIVIPDKYYDSKTDTLYLVTEILPDVFAKHTVNSIVVPDSVTTISQGAFSNCIGLTSITLPFVGKSKSASDYEGVFGYIFNFVTRTLSSETVENATYQYYSSSKYYHYFIPQTLKSVTINGGTINYRAFYNCANLTNVNLSEGITSIGSDAFYNCANLTNVNLSEGVTSIGSDAFYNCNGLLTMHIPASLTSIGSSAFTNCNSLQSFTVADGNKQYLAYDGIIYDYKATTSIVIPKDLSGDVHLHSNMNTIGASAFEGRVHLTSVIFDDNITTIGSRAFYGCTALKTLTIPDALTEIASYTFYNCANLNDITIPVGVTLIGEYAFYGCSALTKIDIPQNVGTIGKAAFAYCVFDTITVNKRNASFKAEDNCLIEKMTNILVRGNSSSKIPNDVKEIADYAFSGCTFTEITIPNNVQKIGSSVFSGCSGLTEIIIPDGVNGSIDYYMFAGCTSLTKVVIGKDISSISSAAFRDCKVLESIVLPFLNSYLNRLFGGSYTSDYKYVPSTLKEVTILGGNISDYAFDNCSGLTSVTIGDSVTSIGKWAFEDCSGLTSVNINDLSAWCKIDFGSYSANPLYYAKHLYQGGQEITNLEIPQDVTEIKAYAFSGCSGLTSVTIGDSVQTIGGSAFDGCSGLTSVTIGDSVTRIGDYAFENCNGLTSVTIGDSVTTIGRYAFYNCSGLTSITIPNSVTTIGDYAFKGCSGLTSVTIGNSVTTIGSSAFSGCSGLTSITIPDSVTSIGDYAFSYCDGLTSVTFTNPNGWEVSKNEDMSSAQSLDDLNNSKQNATYLKNTYRDYYWKRG